MDAEPSTSSKEDVVEMAVGVGEVDGEEVVLEQNEEYAFDYDSSIQMTQEQNLLFDLYQPVETTRGTLICRICARGDKNAEFPDRNAFTAHRYKAHGSFNNNILCPVLTCRESFASMGILRRHLMSTHELPLEVHQNMFPNIGEFEKWRHMVESSLQCRFMMHSKQPKNRRQVMHCSRSEHKLVLQSSKHKLPRIRMAKEGACCPAHISFRIDPNNGHVHCYAQLYHIGHAVSTEQEDGESAGASASLVGRPIGTQFPVRPPNYGKQPMQYVQIDVIEMDSTVYGTAIYEHLLIITDLKTGFIWAHGLTDPTKQLVTRLLTAIFCQFGLPEGYSCAYAPTLIRESMRNIESIYATEMIEVWNEPIDYGELEHSLLCMANDEMESAHRWPEVLQFAIMEMNQKSFSGLTPFERMFNRKPPDLYDNVDDDDEVSDPYRNTNDNSDKIAMEKHLIEVKREILDSGYESESPLSYKAGEKVYLRSVVKKPGRGNSLPFLYGYIAEVDNSKPFFPYKVHYSRNENPWPSEANIYAWTSIYDILPTTHSIRSINDDERKLVLSKMYCSCSGARTKEDDSNKIDVKISRCALFRNLLCVNKMSLSCCKAEGKQKCRYHSLYPTSDDTYKRLDLALKTYHKTGSPMRTSSKDIDEELIENQSEKDVEVEESAPITDKKLSTSKERETQRGKRKRQEVALRFQPKIYVPPVDANNTPPRRKQSKSSRQPQSPSRRSSRRVKSKTYEDFVMS